jgi:hypothetical protein
MRSLRCHLGVHLACLLAITACGDDMTTNDGCLGADLVRVTPEADTINVGDSLTYSAELIPSSCLPADATENWRWSIFESTTARIDSLSGTAAGISPGTAVVHVEDAASHVEGGAVLVVGPVEATTHQPVLEP